MERCNNYSVITGRPTGAVGSSIGSAAGASIGSAATTVEKSGSTTCRMEVSGVTGVFNKSPEKNVHNLTAGTIFRYFVCKP